jgi:hypothetical protein
LAVLSKFVKKNRLQLPRQPLRPRPTDTESTEGERLLSDYLFQDILFFKESSGQQPTLSHSFLHKETPVQID